MSFQDEIEKLQKVRRAFLRFAIEENSVDRLWSGPVDRRYARIGDAAGLVPLVGTVVRFSTLNRSLANFLNDIEIPSINVELLDPDREWRRVAGGIDDQLIYRNVSFWLRALDDLGTTLYDQRVAVAQIKRPSFPPGKRVSLDCQVTSGNILGDQIPRRFITTTDFPNAPAEVQGLPVPIIYGRRHNDVVPFEVPGATTSTVDPLPGGDTESDIPATLPAMTGGETIRCDDLFTDNFESGTLSGYTSGAGGFTVVNGAGASGSKGLRPTAAANLLTRTVTPPRRGFCISWSSDSDQALSGNTLATGALVLYRLNADLVVEVGKYGALTTIAGGVTSGTRQTFKVEGAFATENFRTTTAAAVQSSDATITVPTGDGARFINGERFIIDDEVLSVTSRAGDVLTVSRGLGDSVPAYHNPGAAIIVYDTNGYLKVYVDGVVRASYFNDDRINSGLADGLWGTVSLGPSGDGDDWTIGSGLVYTPGAPGATTEAGATSPFAGDPLNPSPTPECEPATAGGSSPSGGAVRALLVGKYVAAVQTAEEAAAPLITVPVPQPTISVVGPGGTGAYQYVVTAIADVPGAADPMDWSARTNQIGESAPSPVVSVTNGPTRDSDFSKDNYIHIEWPVLPGIKFYRVYGRYMDYEPFSLLDVYTGESGGVAYYNDGEFNGRDEFDILKTDAKPGTGWTSGGGGGSGGAADNNIYVLAGHALKAVDEVYVLKPVVIQNFTSDGSTEPVRSEPVQVLQVEGVDYTQEVRDINGRRYHLLVFRSAQVSETCEYYEVTANVRGAETNADTTGTLIENADEIFAHAMLNWILNSYQSGPWFTDVPYAPGLWNADSVIAAKAVAEQRLAGGYKGSGTLDEVIEAREWIREMLTSWDLELYFNNTLGPAGAWSISRFDPTMERSTLPLIDAGTDIIFKETFASDDDPTKMFNIIPFFGGPTSQRTGKNDLSTQTSGGGWLVSGDAQSSASISRFGLAPSQPVYLKWTEDVDTVSSVMAYYLRYLEVPPVTASFRMALRALDLPLGSLVRVTHPDGIGPDVNGWVEHVCEIIRSDIDLDRLTANLTVVSRDALMTT